MQDVAPSAVRIALAIDTMICAINLAVSFFVINYLLSFSLIVISSPLLVISSPLLVIPSVAEGSLNLHRSDDRCPD